jgi:type IV pilus assembly protein PilB
MGVPAYNIAASVTLIVAQRLVRKLCRCRRPAGQRTGGYLPQGCSACNHTGYRGRTGIYQVMPVSAAMQALILAQAATTDIARQARTEGVIDLRRAGLLKVLRGDTSLGEVLACT